MSKAQKRLKSQMYSSAVQRTHVRHRDALAASTNKVTRPSTCLPPKVSPNLFELPSYSIKLRKPLSERAGSGGPILSTGS
mmetsp:Transcript_28439/g.64418  ORF Transcript_28439/g.64418 Transcript_28439/m.64418 type:complete len:80 (-) Transcript_28439:489-728(-)